MSITNLPEITKDYLIRVGNKEIDGQSLLRLSGRNIDVDTALADIGMEDVLFTWPTSVSTLEAISSNADDTLAGTGARIITVNGLDSNFDEISENINMNGTSVTSATSATFIRVNSVTVKEAGTYADTDVGSNEGDITIRISGGGATLAFISNDPSGVGFNQDFKFTIPTNKTGIIIGASVNVDATKQAKLHILVRENADIIVAPFSPKRIAASVIQSEARDVPNENLNSLLAAKTDIWASGIGNAVNTEMEVTMTILLLDD